MTHKLANDAKQEAQRAIVAHLSTMNVSKRISGLWIGGGGGEAPIKSRKAEVSFIHSMIR